MKKLDTAQSIALSINHFLEGDFSIDYKRDIKNVGTSFIFFVVTKNLHTLALKDLEINIIEGFLNSFYDESTNNKGTYENKRKTLRSIFKHCVDQKIIPINPFDHIEIKTTERTRKNLFTDQELFAVFSYLKSNFPEFYVFASINYYLLYKKITTLSREIKKGDFSDDFSTLKIMYDGKEISLPVDQALKSILLEQGVDKLKNELNIFSKNTTSYDRHYFNKKWLKIKQLLLQNAIISHLNYDIDVFIDCAVFRYYEKNTDVKKLQKLLGFGTPGNLIYYLESIIDFSE
jgi:hypothetical protein